MSSEEITVRRCRPGEARAVLELWEQERSGHASIGDRLEDVERLAGDSPAALLIAEREGESAGYRLDREIGRRVRNI